MNIRGWAAIRIFVLVNLLTLLYLSWTAPAFDSQQSLRPQICILGNAESPSMAKRVHEMWGSEFQSVFYVWGKLHNGTGRTLLRSSSKLFYLVEPRNLTFAEGLTATLTQARELERARLFVPCDYYFTHDDDLQFFHAYTTQESLQATLVHLLSKYRPAVFSFPYDSGSGNASVNEEAERLRKIQDRYRAEHSQCEVIPLTAADNGMVLYHRNVVDMFVPPSPRGEGGFTGHWTLPTNFITLFAPLIFQHKALVASKLLYRNQKGFTDLFSHPTKDWKYFFSIGSDGLVHYNISRHPYEWTRKKAYRRFLAAGLHRLDARFGFDFLWEDISWRGIDPQEGDGRTWTPERVALKLASFYDCRHEAIKHNALLQQIPAGMLYRLVKSTPWRLRINMFAYRRPSSFQRLLDSLEAAAAIDIPIDIHVFVDKDESVEGSEQRRLAMSLRKSKHGPIHVHLATSPLGLKESIMRSWKPTDANEYCVFLEDDIELSPFSLVFAKDVISATFYASERAEKLLGVSLYRYVWDDQTLSPWRVSFDGLYVWQRAQSWGAAYSARGWATFLEWYSSHLSMDPIVPGLWSSNVWPSSLSWKKYLIRFMYEEGFYMVYFNSQKNCSFTTNHFVLGTNNENISAASFTDLRRKYEVPLCRSPESYPSDVLVSTLPVLDVFGRSRPSLASLQSSDAAALDECHIVLCAQSDLRSVEDLVQHYLSLPAVGEIYVIALSPLKFSREYGKRVHVVVQKVRTCFLRSLPTPITPRQAVFFTSTVKSPKHEFLFAFYAWRASFTSYLLGFNTQTEQFAKHNGTTVLQATRTPPFTMLRFDGVFLLWSMYEFVGSFGLSSYEPMCQEVLAQLLLQNLTKQPLVIVNSSLPSSRSNVSQRERLACLRQAQGLFRGPLPLHDTKVAFRPDGRYGPVTGQPPHRGHLFAKPTRKEDYS